MNLKELYQEIILEHGKNPRNLRKTEGFNKDAKGNNPLCGDNVHVYLKLNGQKIVEDASFEGSGCAISMASASIMTDLIKGIHPHDIATILDDDGVAIRAGHHCCQILHEKIGVPATARASIGLYNSKDDIDVLLNAINKCKKVFKI